MHKKLLLALIALVAFSMVVTAFNYTDGRKKANAPIISSIEMDSATLADDVEIEVVKPNNSPASDLYTTLNLGAKKLNKNAFDLAMKGFDKMKKNGKIKQDLVTIVDFSQPSTSKRMYIIDVKARKLLQQTHVAHGRNTGALMATKFSNINESNQSSLGFYLTSETYIGKHGLSLRLDGVEKNINHNARARAIVVHGADYANESFYKSTGYLGRSFGCPAVPTKDAKLVINTIKNGSVMFIYSPDKNYLKQSNLIG